MKKVIVLVLFVLMFHSGWAQSEFKTYSNGLIYDTTTMYHLGVIVDSLNLKFNTCDLNRPYYSFLQGSAHYIKIPNKTAKKLLQSGISFKEYEAKYPLSVKKKSMYVIQYTYSNYKGEPMLEYSGLPGSAGPEIRLSNTGSNNKSSGWVMNSNDAFFLNELSSSILPERFARLVQYVDCMIDTTSQIYFPDARGRTYQLVEDGSAADKFIKWGHDYPRRPARPEYDEDTPEKYDSLWSIYTNQYRRRDSLRLVALDDKFKNSSFRQAQLLQAWNEAIETGNSDETLEFYVARYLSKDKALYLKRSRRVIGGCSMDDRPRIHATQICMLAAETYQWDVFLRSHLDIMNDRFDRVSDGSYAWEGRKTYLKELEELGINVTDLLLGTCLRVRNVSDSHYFGSIGRVGRAIAETSNHDDVKSMIYSVIKDEEVDIFNRVLFAYLFLNYNRNLVDAEMRAEAVKEVKTIIKDLPDELKVVLDSGN
ncbi:MAG: hypothetical protein AAGA64_18100 [Bacteroidota bacterium]